MEKITVGESVLPSGRVIERLSIKTRLPPEQSAFKLLTADDGVTVYARQYPHLDANRKDEWDPVGPYTGDSEGADQAYGFETTQLREFVKDA